MEHGTVRPTAGMCLSQDSKVDDSAGMATSRMGRMAFPRGRPRSVHAYPYMHPVLRKHTRTRMPPTAVPLPPVPPARHTHWGGHRTGSIHTCRERQAGRATHMTCGWLICAFAISPPHAVQ